MRDKHPLKQSFFGVIGAIDQIKTHAHHRVQHRPHGAKHPLGRVKRRLDQRGVPAVGGTHGIDGRHRADECRQITGTETDDEQPDFLMDFECA